MQGTLTCKCMNSYGVLKCLVAASLHGKHIETIVDDSSKLPISFEPLTSTNARLTDPVAISWLLSKPNYSSTIVEAETLQWAFYAQSELNPYLWGYLQQEAAKSPRAPPREAAFQQKQRLLRLSKSLIRLDEHLEQKTFLVGERLTLADTNLAIDILPLFHVLQDDGRPLIKKVCPTSKLVNLTRWHETIIQQPQFKAVYKAHLFQPPDSLVVTGARNKATAPATISDRRLLKILCLHGYRQTSKTFHEKLGSFRKLVGKKCEFKLVNAPHLVPSAELENGEQRGWWFSQPHGYFKSDDVSDCDKGLEESLGLIKRAIEEDGPFDGIMGFSQGAALAALICLMQEFRGTFRFAMLFAPFMSACTKHAKFYDLAAKCDMPTLFVIGEGDQVVFSHRSEALTAFFSHHCVVKHDGGHFVPATSKQKQSYLTFLDAQRQ